MKERKVTLHRKRRKLGVADLTKDHWRKTELSGWGMASHLPHCRVLHWLRLLLGQEKISLPPGVVWDIPAQKCRAVTGGVCMRAPTPGMPDSRIFFLLFYVLLSFLFCLYSFLLEILLYRLYRFIFWLLNFHIFFNPF